MAKENIFEREINSKEELQEILRKETGRTDITVDDYALIQDPHTHPATGERYYLYGARAQVTVGNKIWHVDKDRSYPTIADASNAVVADVETVCCKN